MNSVQHVVSVFAKPFLDQGGSISLGKVALLVCTSSTLVSVWAESRQLRHMSSSAYKAPVHWYKNEENKELDELPQISLYKTRLQKARHQIRHSIVQTGSTWLQNVGLILGGYDKLWQFSRRFSEQVTTSANAMPGRLLTTTTFILLNVLLGQTVGSFVTTSYCAVTSADISSTTQSVVERSRLFWRNIFYMNNKEKKEEILTWPTWKHLTIAYTAFIALAGAPLMATTALYEWMGPNAVASMTKSVLLIGGLCFTALNWPIMLAQWRGKLNSTVKDPREGATWPTLAEWAEHNETRFEIGKLMDRARCTLPKDMEITIVVKPKDTNGSETAEEGKTLCAEPTISDLPTGGLLVCFGEAQVGNLDFSVLTAMLADAIYPIAGGVSPVHILNQLLLIIDMSSFPILHRWYCQQPTLLLDVFPNLPPADLYYVPLGVSWTMTMFFLELSFGVQAFVQYLAKRAQHKRDYLIANRFADYAEGESKVLVEQQQYAIEQGVPDWDIGTTDKMYAFFRTGGSLSTTERISALQESIKAGAV